MTTYIGVDGGGTKTHVLVMSGQRGATVTSTASNPQTVGMASAQQIISEAIESCLQALDLHSVDVTGLSICMAGVDREDEANHVKAEFSRLYPGAVLEVKNDALAALTAGTKGEPGVVLIAGTGSIAVGESATGSVVRAGGYGYLLGDEGSGFQLGQKGLIAAIQSYEGRAPQTELWERAVEVFGVSNAMELIPIVYRSERPVPTVAKFAQEVVSLSNTDPVAREIVAAAVSDYVQLIDSVLRRLEGDVTNVVLAGGLFTNTDILLTHLQSAKPSLKFHPLTNSAASGAVLRAMKESYRVQGQPIADAVALWEQNLNRMRMKEAAGAGAEGAGLASAGSEGATSASPESRAGTVVTFG